jgi:beta-aspartyl-peptidase (threonine type)
VLRDGGTALDAVETAILILEDDPTFDAGHGSFPTQNGEVELDAGLMDGTTLDVGAVACVIGIPQPIRLARLVLEGPHVLMAGEGARQLAKQHGLPTCDSADLVPPGERWQEFSVTDTFGGPSDTVGAVALDAQGTIVAGLSTGGQPGRPPGRVGDVPQVGCGFYADSPVGGVVCSGWGEAIARVALAHRAMVFLEAGLAPQEAAENAIQFMQDRVQGYAGILIVNPKGQIGVAFNSRRFARAYWSDGMDKPVAAVDRNPWKR